MLPLHSKTSLRLTFRFHFYFLTSHMLVYPGVVVQSLSCVRLFATPWAAARQAPLPFTISWSLLTLMSTGLVVPSSRRGSLCSYSTETAPSRHQPRSCSPRAPPCPYLCSDGSIQHEVSCLKSLSSLNFCDTTLGFPSTTLVMMFQTRFLVSLTLFPVHHLHLDIHRHLKCRMSDTGPSTWTPYTAPAPPIKPEVIWDSEVQSISKSC